MKAQFTFLSGSRTGQTDIFSQAHISIGRHPQSELRFDADKAMGAETRKKVFGMIAADRIPFIGYHMPFPAVGYAEPKDAGFRFVPQSYQHLLEG